MPTAHGNIKLTMNTQINIYELSTVVLFFLCNLWVKWGNYTQNRPYGN